MQRDELRIAIIGAGPGGLCMGKRLLDEGYSNFVVLERSDDVGGTWNRNRYPGCECDVPSALYSFSFEFKADWSKPYGTQPEILEYLRHIARSYGLLPHIRFGTAVVSAHWDEVTSTWTLTLETGEQLAADVVVSALGMFNDLSWPDIDGLDEFEGDVWHSAQWDWDHDLHGERVAVIGSAASAVQFVPEIVPVAAQVHLFQRTANWVLPKIDSVFTEEQLIAFRNDPAPLLKFRVDVERNMNQGMTFADVQMNAEREAAVHAAIDSVVDPVVREKLRPTHPYGCKRPLFSNKFYPVFNEPNLELVTDPIERVTDRAVVTRDGTERVVDVIVVATGFAATKYLSAIDVVGRGGETIADAWNDGPLAYLGITTSGFPNLFMLYGPNTNNGSILSMLEYQADHVLGHLARLADDLQWIDVRPATMERYNADVQSAIAEIPVWQSDCHGYYRSPSGRIVTQWPYSMIEYERRTTTVDFTDFELHPRTLDVAPR